MIVGAYFGTLLVRTLTAIIVGVGVRMRMGMHSGLNDSAGVFVDVLESRRVRAAEHDPEDHQQGHDESPHRSAANTPGGTPQHRKVLACST